MTPQQTPVFIGLAAGAVARFYFGKDWGFSITVGLGAISVYAILTAHKDEKKTT